MVTASPLVIQTAAPARRAPARRAPAARRRFGAKAKPKISLAVVAGLMPQVQHIKDRYNGGGGIVNAISKGLQTGMLGYNPDTKVWAIGNAKLGIIPLVAGIGVHKLAGKLGINRALAKAGIPFVNV